MHLVGILKPNVDPHGFEPTPSTAIALAGAKLVVESGVGVDGWADRLIAELGAGRRRCSSPLRACRSGPATPRSRTATRTGGTTPPCSSRPRRAWRAELGRVDPAHAGAYRANAARYVAEIRAMDRANMRLIATVPRAQRKLVTNHDAFGYFAAHYGITVVGSVIPSLSTAAEPSAESVAELIRKIQAEHVRAIFTESSLNPGLERQIADEAGVAVYANLYGDTLGETGSPGATYVGMERWNMRAMVAGFLGTSPPSYSRRPSTTFRRWRSGRPGRRMSRPRLAGSLMATDIDLTSAHPDRLVGVIAAENATRVEISARVHDEIVQIAAASRLVLDRARRPGQDAAAVEQLHQRLGELLEHIRRRGVQALARAALRKPRAPRPAHGAARLGAGDPPRRQHPRRRRLAPLGRDRHGRLPGGARPVQRARAQPGQPAPAG